MHLTARLLRTVILTALSGAIFLATAEARRIMPSGADLIRKVRANEQHQYHNFVGQIRTSTSRSKIVVPFNLTMRGGTMVYEFTSPPPEALILTLSDSSSRLERATGRGKARVISGGRLDEAVRGTDITYEDLALKFLYWNRARTVGEDTKMTRHCWVVETYPDRPGESQYDRVRIWIEKSGAMLKAECYKGQQKAAQFEVRKVQKAPQGGYVLKSMTISRVDPATGRDRRPTYLELTPVGE